MVTKQATRKKTSRTNGAKARAGGAARARADAAFIPDHHSEWEPTQRWVRAKFANVTVADSKRVMLLRETGHLPVYYFPTQDVRTDLLMPNGHTAKNSHLGTAAYSSLKVNGHVAENAAWTYIRLTPGAPNLKGYVAFEWNKMDAWFEEDDEVFVHPRDPYKRIDVLHSSRHIQVVIDGETVADTRRPRLLFETGLPTRYYIPKTDVRMDLLVSSDKHTRCPYKGVASYYSVKLGDKVYPDLVWYYPLPIPECPKVENLLCFFNEQVDIYMDGELQPRPVTPWS
jgi:uncharacterized protein (DUF427 family)